jgi:hypothetical protein
LSEESLLAASLNQLFLMMLIPDSSDALMELRWQGLFSLQQIQTSERIAAMSIKTKIVKE